MKVRFYKQHSMETCGIACLLMILDAFDKDFPTIGKEQAYYARYRSRVMPGTSMGAIAYALTRAGLDVTLMHASPALMDNRDGYNSPELHAQLLAEHRAFLERAGDALTLRCGEPVTPSLLRNELAQDKLVLVEVYIPGDADGIHDHVLHGILLYGTQDNEFLACDPLQGRIRLSETELAILMDTPYGTTALCVGRKAAANLCQEHS